MTHRESVLPFHDALIPAPLSLRQTGGEFQLKPEARIVVRGAAPADLADLLADYLRRPTGFSLPVVRQGTPVAGDIVLECDAAERSAASVEQQVERYDCRVAPDRVQLSAPAEAGLARAIQTLRQLFPADILADTYLDRPWTVPCVRIEDAPRFGWRGMHLDVSRHFFSVDEVCRLIDILALHRYNRVHLHLTDDQGWRIEIAAYPKLTDVGSVRPCTLVGHQSERPRRYDNAAYGGFFTQAEIRQLVAFAARRRITLMPEIDMPGHMQAAVAAYPELGNTTAAIEPRCHWGISQHILNVEPGTIEFMANVLGEVMDLFPGRFIHVGGDEAVKHEWEESRRVQARMRELGVGDENELQSWFIHRMNDRIAARDRRLIGWDEITAGALPADAAVISWRSEKGGIDAAHRGIDVVMAPAQWLYFDHYQAEPAEEEPLAIGGMSTTGHVYAYDPVPKAIPPEKRHHVLGGQGQLWTEYIPDAAALDRMAFPRACALAEVLWLPPEHKTFSGFLKRLAVHRRRLEALEVHAHPRP